MKSATLKKALMMAIPLLFGAMLAVAADLENEVANGNAKFDGALKVKASAVQVQGTYGTRGAAAAQLGNLTSNPPAIPVIRGSQIQPTNVQASTGTPTQQEKPSFKKQFNEFLGNAKPWIVTGVVGAILGFLVGGPIGAVVGAAAMMGFGYMCRM